MMDRINTMMKSNTKEWRKAKRLLAFLLCSMLVVSLCFPNVALAANDMDDGGDASGDAVIDMTDLSQGNDADILVSNYSSKGNKAGEEVTISFTLNANANSSKRYSVNGIQRVCPMVDESFPFETSDAVYRITSGSSNTLNVNYTFKAKDNLETAYYPVNFVVVYGRKSKTTGTDIYADNDYFVTKTVSVKMIGKPEVTTTEATTTETASEDSDVSIRVTKTPTGVYGKSCSVAFTAVSKSYMITGVTPVIGEGYPFETKGDSYKTVASKGTKNLPCKYNFTVRTDVATGYQPVSFAITYKKNKQTFTVNRTINVKLTGKKEKKDAESTGAKSTPRLMVTGCDTSVEKIHPNDTFDLTVHLKNTAKSAVSNIKVALSSDEIHFIPTSGATNAFVDSIGAGQTADVTFALQASSELGAQIYTLNVKTEYENAKADAFSAEDMISLPVYLEERVSLSEITPPELTMDSEGDLSVTIINTGGGAINNVRLNCEGEDFTCEEAYVGNIAGGATEYGSITLVPKKLTVGEGKCKVIVTYETKEGETKTITEETYVYVSESDMEDLDQMMDENKPSAKHTGLWTLLVLVLVVVIVIIVLVVKAKKKKRLLAEEEEWMDDDL